MLLKCLYTNDVFCIWRTLAINPEIIIFLLRPEELRADANKSMSKLYSIALWGNFICLDCTLTANKPLQVHNRQWVSMFSGESVHLIGYFVQSFSHEWSNQTKFKHSRGINIHLFLGLNQAFVDSEIWNKGYILNMSAKNCGTGGCTDVSSQHNTSCYFSWIPQRCNSLYLASYS